MTANIFNYTKQNGVLMKAKRRYTKQNGVLKKILSGWTKQNGVVEQVYTSSVPAQFVTLIPVSDVAPAGEGMDIFFYVDNQKIIYLEAWAVYDPTYDAGVKIYMDNDYVSGITTQPIVEWSGGGTAWPDTACFNYAGGVSANQSIIQEESRPHEVSIGSNPGIISDPQYTESGAMTIAKITTDTFAGITYTSSASQLSSKVSIISPSGRERSNSLGQDVGTFYRYAGLGLYDGRGVAVGYKFGNNNNTDVWICDFDNAASTVLEDKVTFGFVTSYYITSGSSPNRNSCSSLLTFDGSDVYFSLDFGMRGSPTPYDSWLYKYNVSTKTVSKRKALGVNKKLIATYNNYVYVLAAGSSETQTSMIIEKYDTSLDYVSSHNVPYDSNIGRITHTISATNSPIAQMNNKYTAFKYNDQIVLLDLDLF